MSTMYGADVAQLRQLASQFDSRAQTLDADRMTVGNAIQISAWVGPVAVRFRHSWESDYSRKLHDAAVGLRDAATRLRANADEQEKVSAVDAGAGRSAGLAHKEEHEGHAPAPTSTADLYRALHGMDGEDGVRIQVVRGEDGIERIVVYINGTAADSAGRFTTGSNITLMAGGGTESLAHVRALVAAAAAEHPGAEIMLAGYSQGGIVAQRLAQEGVFNITTVLTYGSPRLLSGGLDGVDIVRLEHNGDPIPGTDLEGVMAGEVDAVNASNARRAGGSDVVFRAGNPFQGGTAMVSAVAAGIDQGARDGAQRGAALFSGVGVPGVREVLQFGAAGVGSFAGSSSGAVSGFGEGFIADNAHIDQSDYRWLSDQFDNSSRPEDVHGREAIRRFGGTVVSDVK